MLTLPRREEEDDPVRPQRVLEGGDERDGRLADPRRGVREEMLAFIDRPPRVGEELGLAVPNPIERPRNGDRWRANRLGRLQRLHVRPREDGLSRGREDMKGFLRERDESTRVACGRG